MNKPLRSAPYYVCSSKKECAYHAKLRAEQPKQAKPEQAKQSESKQAEQSESEQAKQPSQELICQMQGVGNFSDSFAFTIAF